uniref:Putative kunitz n=1 Tax=Rhipicephalus microplus TaxID=6941 RepID=A0A6G5A9X4_RHIMP
MGLLFRCNALVMCITIVSGNIGNNEPDGNLYFLPGTGPGSGSSAAGKIPERCTKPPEKGYCRAFVPTWYFDFNRRLCRIFIYGGCGGNDNQFSSEKRCQEVCLPGRRTQRLCSLKPEPGGTGILCRRWYFDRNYGTCSLFSNNQCARNANGFYSCKICMRRCSNLKATEVCQLARSSTKPPSAQEQQTGNNTTPFNRPSSTLPE